MTAVNQTKVLPVFLNICFWTICHILAFFLAGAIWSFLGYSGASHQRSVQVAGLHVFISVRKGDLVNVLDYGSKQRNLPE